MITFEEVKTEFSYIIMIKYKGIQIGTIKHDYKFYINLNKGSFWWLGHVLKHEEMHNNHDLEELKQGFVKVFNKVEESFIRMNKKNL